MSGTELAGTGAELVFDRPELVFNGIELVEVDKRLLEVEIGISVKVTVLPLLLVVVTTLASDRVPLGATMIQPGLGHTGSVPHVVMVRVVAIVVVPVPERAVVQVPGFFWVIVTTDPPGLVG